MITLTDLVAVSAFAGVGGFDLAFDRAGIRTVATIEKDPASRAVLAHHWPTTTHLTDILEVSGDDLRTAGFVPERGILAGGFPCQDLSVAGRRAGMDRGTRSGLFWELDRLMAEVGPRWVVFENVPGLLSSNNGRDLGTVFGAMAKRGYGFAYRVLDAQFFGVAQRRRRVFIVGRLGDDGTGPASVLFDGTGGGGDSATRPQAWEGSPAGPGGGSGSRRVVSPILASGTDGRGSRIDVEGAIGGQLITFRKSTRAQTDQHDETWIPDDKSNTLNTFDSGDSRATELVLQRDVSYAVTSKWSKGTGGPSGDEVQNLTTRGGIGVRRLMPIETERLQGFPDNWTGDVAGRIQADSHRYRQMGNALAVPVAEWIARRIVAVDAELMGPHVCEECGDDDAMTGEIYCLDCMERLVV